MRRLQLLNGRGLHGVVGLLTIVTAMSALGQSPASSPKAPASGAVGEIFSVRARYGVAMRNGSQTDIGPGLNYSGLTPNDAAVSGAYWLGGGMFGLGLSGQREGFGLFDTTGAKITSGSLLRGYAGPTARLVMGPFRVEALAGYGMAQLPSFGNSVTPEFSAALRHGPEFAARLAYTLPFGVTLEARGNYPLALFATDASGNAATASGYSGGGALIWNAGNAGQLTYALVLDYQYVHDTLSVGTEIAAQQTISRAGLAIELGFLDKVPPPPPPKYGGLLITVVDADTGAPLPAAKLVLTGNGRSLRYQQEGNVFRARDLDPGEVTAKVALGGYIPAEGKGTIVAGLDGNLELRAKKEPPKVGSLMIVLVDKETAAPIANAKIVIKGQEYQSGPGGNLMVKDLPPGPVALKVEANEYRPLQEVASVVAFKTSTVPLQMSLLKKKVPATITGVVRSTRGGAPIAATLEIPEASINTTASAQGTFAFKIGGGTYTVRISAPGYLPQRKSVSVKDGDQAIFNVDLHPATRSR